MEVTCNPINSNTDASTAVVYPCLWVRGILPERQLYCLKNHSRDWQVLKPPPLISDNRTFLRVQLLVISSLSFEHYSIIGIRHVYPKTGLVRLESTLQAEHSVG